MNLVFSGMKSGIFGVIGYVATKNFEQGKIINKIKGGLQLTAAVVAGAVSGADSRMLLLSPSIAFAASAWKDAADWKFSQASKKMAAASFMANVAMNGDKEWSEVTLGRATTISTLVAGAGLVYATGAPIWNWLSQVGKRIGEESKAGPDVPAGGSIGVPKR